MKNLFHSWAVSRLQATIGLQNLALSVTKRWVGKYFTYHKIYQQCLHLVMKGCWFKLTEVESYHDNRWHSQIVH